jgi:hypothetical protein
MHLACARLENCFQVLDFQNWQGPVGHIEPPKWLKMLIFVQTCKLTYDYVHQ